MLSSLEDSTTLPPFVLASVQIGDTFAADEHRVESVRDRCLGGSSSLCHLQPQAGGGGQGTDRRQPRHRSPGQPDARRVFGRPVPSPPVTGRRQGDPAVPTAPAREPPRPPPSLARPTPLRGHVGQADTPRTVKRQGRLQETFGQQLLALNAQNDALGIQKMLQGA